MGKQKYVFVTVPLSKELVKEMDEIIKKHPLIETRTNLARFWIKEAIRMLKKDDYCKENRD